MCKAGSEVDRRLLEIFKIQKNDTTLGLDDFGAGEKEYLLVENELP